MSGPAGDQEKARMEFDYAWGWFQYHAAQRLTSFNFFLVLTGFLLVGFGQAVANDWRPVGIAVGLLGVLVAAGFCALDVRNEELVIGGSRALKQLEEESAVKVAGASDSRENLDAALGERRGKRQRYERRGEELQPRSWTIDPTLRRDLFRHRVWLRLIPTFIGGAFLVGAAWAALSFPGVPGASASARRDGRRVQRCELVVSPSVRAPAQYRILRCADDR